MNEYDDKPFLSSNILIEDMLDIYSRPLPWGRLRGSIILVTGATGMLASYLVYFLIWLNEEHNFNLRIFMLLRNMAKARKCFGIYLDRPYICVVEQDVIKPLDIEDRVDYIIHAASLASPQYYGVKPVEVAAPNVLGTYFLLEMARSHSVKAFLYFSSGDVYGKLPADMGVIHETSFGTLDPLDAHSCYGESKRMGETFCASFAREYNVPTRIARIAHTYGPTMDVEHDPRVFASFVKCVLHGEDIIMFSDGSARRPFCYLADATAAFFHILLQGKHGEAYNVANEQMFVSISELADKLATLRPERGIKVVRQVRPVDEAYLECKANLGNLPSTIKLKDLGWNCNYDLEKGFGRTLSYFEEQCQATV